MRVSSTLLLAVALAAVASATMWRPTCAVVRCRSGYECKMLNRPCPPPPPELDGPDYCPPVPSCVVISKEVTPVVIPENCVSWYDGCNRCLVRDGLAVGCTRRHCIRLAPTQCLGYAEVEEPAPENPNEIIPFGCKTWYDGCNTCAISKGAIDYCTELACFRMDTPKCLAFEAEISEGDVIPFGCESWYDGCNVCSIKDGRENICSKRMCVRKDTPKCLKFFGQDAN